MVKELIPHALNVISVEKNIIQTKLLNALN